MDAQNSYREALENAKHELLALRQERDYVVKKQEQLEERIIELRRTVAALAALCHEAFDEDDEFGLTDSIRMALKTHGRVLDAQQVKARLEQLGYKTTSTNLLASVHTVLKRLALKGEVDDSVLINGKPGYRWITPNPKPPPVPSERKPDR